MTSSFRAISAVFLLSLLFAFFAAPSRAQLAGHGAAGSPVEQSNAERVRALRLESARPLLESKLKQSQEERFLYGRKAPAELNCVVIGCDFSDSLLWGRDRDQFPGWPAPQRGGNYLYDSDSNALTDDEGRPIYEFAAHDSLYFDIQMRKTDDYFRTVSRGQFQMQWQPLRTLVNLPQPMGYYGADLDNSLRLVEMAMAIVDSVDAEVDFSLYDTVVVIHAGAGQETDINGDSPEQLFSNYLDPRDFEEAQREGLLEEAGIPTDDGVLVRHVLILPETQTQDAVPELGLNGFFGMRGVFCFEFGLRLGMLSLADFTPSGRPDSQGIGNYGLMGYGLFTGLGIVPAEPCAMNRQLMGWVDPVVVQEDARIDLPAIGTGQGDTLLVKAPITDREYFLLEYRLQDPDGTYTFSFEDLNGNRVPDFFDADSDSLDGQPTSSFDPTTDTWESTLGAEWDYFMSEFFTTEADGPLRGIGRGSALYVWHIDERVILDSFTSLNRGINSDPQRKGVDLEEADGVQDLDSRKATRFILGWDNDGFRGEGVEIAGQLFGTSFGPQTVPRSDSGDGQWTGFSITDIDSVGLDPSNFEPCPSCPLGGRFLYAQRLGFQLGFSDDSLPQGLTLDASRSLDRYGPLHEPRIADLDDDGASEIVLAGAEGALLAFRGDLSEWADGDADSTTIGVLAFASGPSGPPLWRGAPVVGDLDGDGVVEIYASDATAVYAFALDGSELRDGDGDPSTRGVFLLPPPVGLEPSVLSHPVLLSPFSGDLDTARPGYRAKLVMIFRADAPGSPVRARLVEWDGSGEPSFEESSEVSNGTARAGVLAEDQDGIIRLFVGGPIDASGGGGGIRLGAFLGLDKAPGDPVPPEATQVPSELISYRARQDQRFGVSWVDTLGTLATENGIQGAQLEPLWSPFAAGPSASQAAPVFAIVSNDALWLLDRNLSLRTGGPYRPYYAGSTVEGADPAAPVLVDLDGDGQVELIWHDRVGRVHAVGLDSQALHGWPFQGPGEPSGSPAIADLDGDARLELFLCAGFDALVDMDADERLPVTQRVGELKVYDLGLPVDAFAPWTQGRGDAWGTGRQGADSRAAGEADSGTVLDEESFVIYPNPATGPTVHLRVAVRRAGQVELMVFDLEGEQVGSAQAVYAEGAGFVDVEFPTTGLAGGMYVARAKADDSVALLPFALVR